MQVNICNILKDQPLYDLLQVGGSNFIEDLVAIYPAAFKWFYRRGIV